MIFERHFVRCLVHPGCQRFFGFGAAAEESLRFNSSTEVGSTKRLRGILGVLLLDVDGALHINYQTGTLWSAHIRFSSDFKSTIVFSFHYTISHSANSLFCIFVEILLAHEIESTPSFSLPLLLPG